MSKINGLIKTWQAKLKDKATKLSVREKIMAAACVIVLLSMGFNKVYTPIYTAFTNQTEDLRQLEMYLTELPNILARNKQLVLRRKQIEEAYQGVEITEGLSHIESVIKEQAELTNSQDYQIREKTLAQSQRDFGGNYEYKSFNVELKIRSLKGLAALLKELTSGRKPMILSNLELSKSPSGEIISVLMELSTIQKKLPDSETEVDTAATEPIVTQ
jgi:hypothetical protein